MEHTKHLWRAVIIICMIPIGFVIVRHFMVPPSFGLYGFYRFDNVAEQMDKSLIHGNPTACQNCHDEVWQKRSKGKHIAVSCETCHAPLTLHIKDDEKSAVMPTDRSYSLCATCHQWLAARPKDFPQVIINEHLEEVGAEMSEGVCLDCHNSHNPTPE